MRDLAVLLFFLTVKVCSGAICKTNNEGPVKNTPCVFPFSFQVETHHSCTNASDDNGKLWCSTKVDPDGYLTKGNWGYCDLDGKALTIYSSFYHKTLFSSIRNARQATLCLWKCPLQDYSSKLFDKNKKMMVYFKLLPTFCNISCLWLRWQSLMLFFIFSLLVCIRWCRWEFLDLRIRIKQWWGQLFECFIKLLDNSMLCSFLS